MRTLAKPVSFCLLQYLFAAIGRNHHQCEAALSRTQGANPLAGLDSINPRHLPVDKRYFVRFAGLGQELRIISIRFNWPEGASSTANVIDESIFDKHRARLRIVVDDQDASATRISELCAIILQRRTSCPDVP